MTCRRAWSRESLEYETVAGMSRSDNGGRGGEDVPRPSIPSGSGMLDKMMVVLRLSTWPLSLSRSCIKFVSASRRRTTSDSRVLM